jgi:succinoglycan biosynthesis transport protein ExoP
MSDQVYIKGFGEHYAGFKRHLKLAAAAFAIITVAGVGFAYSLPDVYKTQSLIFFEEPEIPEAIMRTTINTYASKMITILNEKILTVGKMIEFIDEFELYVDERRDTPVELLAMDMRGKIGIEIQQRDSVSASGMPMPMVVGFSVSFEDESPEKTKLVVDELVSLYLEENLKERAKQTSDISVFIIAEVLDLEKEIDEKELGLAKFKEQNADRMPSMASFNMGSITRIDGQLINITRSLAGLEQNRITIEAQLAVIEPTEPTRLPDGSIFLSPQEQMKSLQTQLSVYESKYSENHPDVIAVKRDIASIKERFGIDVDMNQIDKSIATAKAELAIQLSKYSADHPDVIASRTTIAKLEAERAEVEQNQLDAVVVPDNPAYVQLMAGLDKLDTEEQLLREEAEQLNEDLKEYEQRLAETPLIEKELASLSRDLGSTSNRYWVLRDKQFAAEMGETLETEQKGETMVLLEPARIPLRPFKPNRGAIITLAFLFALVAAVGVTQLADALDKSIRDGPSIIRVQGTPPLIEIPYIFTDAELAQVAIKKKAAIVSLPVMLLITLLVVHLTLQPLDVLFYSLASRLGF